MSCAPPWPCLRDPRHPLHRRWRALCRALEAQQRLPGPEDCERAAAQLLLETWLRGLDPVCDVRVDRDGHLHACCPRGRRRPRRIWLEARQAVAWRVEETSRALTEAVASAPPGWRWPAVAGMAQRPVVSVV